MSTDHERARLQATYADLLEEEADEELLRFIGVLDAAYATPPLPAAVRATLARSGWETTGLASQPDRSRRREWLAPFRAPAAWARERLATPPRSAPGRWTHLHQALNAATTLALVLGIALAAFLLLGNRPPASQGSAPANGNWLYPGSLEGRSGIVSVAPDGTARLLIEGGFYGVTPSPDGQRLIAYGDRDAGIWPAPATAALYTADGRLLRRYTLGGATPLIPYWAPDSRHLAFFARVGAQVGIEGDFRTWLLDEHGEREIQLGRQTLVGTSSGTGVWSSRGELLLSVIAADSNGDGSITTADRQATWVIGADGSNPRHLRDENAANLGWSRDGRTAYLLDAAAITAVNTASGENTTIVRFAAIADELRSRSARQGATEATTITGFAYFPAAIAPSGDRFAIWLTPDASDNATTLPPSYLVVLDTQGRIVGLTRGETNTRPRFVAWSPDGARIAYSYATTGSDLGGIRVVSSTSTTLTDTSPPLAMIANQTPDGLSLRWSPDSRQLAFSINGGVEIASGTDLVKRRPLPGLTFGWPNWQPIP